MRENEVEALRDGGRYYAWDVYNADRDRLGRVVDELVDTYFMTGYLFTLVGAMLIAAMILTNAIVFRYRVWQIVHRRLYESKAPLGDWLRHEFSK